MSCVCCPRCQLRFSQAASIYLAVCPGCGGKPEAITALEDVVGFQLINLQPPVAEDGAAAAAISLPIPSPSGAGT